MKEEKKKNQDGNGEKSGAPKAKAKSRSKRKDPEEPPQVKEPKRKARAAKKSEESGKEKEVEKKEEDGKEEGKGKPGEVAKGRGRQKIAPNNKPSPKPKAKRGAKSKASPKSKTQKTGSKKEEDPEEIPTPRKKLFQSDDEEDGNEDLRLVDPKKEDKKPLKQILEEEMPRNWAKSRTKKGKGAEIGGTAEADPSPTQEKTESQQSELVSFCQEGSFPEKEEEPRSDAAGSGGGSCSSGTLCPALEECQGHGWCGCQGVLAQKGSQQVQ